MIIDKIYRTIDGETDPHYHSVVVVYGEKKKGFPWGLGSLEEGRTGSRDLGGGFQDDEKRFRKEDNQIQIPGPPWNRGKDFLRRKKSTQLSR